MNKIILSLTAIVAGCTLAYGQGQINFTTANGAVNAPLTNALTGAIAGGTSYRAQLYYGPVGSAEDALVALTNAPASLSVAGYVTTGSGGGTRYTQAAVLPAGTPGFFQLRAWSAALGNDWNTAYATWQSGVQPTSVLGKSGIITVTPTASPAQPATLNGLQGFYLVPVPEPGVIALGVIGLAALLWRRRK